MAEQLQPNIQPDYSNVPTPFLLTRFFAREARISLAENFSEGLLFALELVNNLSPEDEDPFPVRRHLRRLALTMNEKAIESRAKLEGMASELRRRTQAE